MSKNIIPVLCCSSEKNNNQFIYKDDQPAVKFVASPRGVSQDGVKFYKPDDKIPEENRTWRDLVLEQKHNNLVPAYLLYKRDIYRELYNEFRGQFYILSAGWGIIRADFKIPAYDITYSTAGDMPEYVKRTDNYGYKDINHLKDDFSKLGRDTEVILFAPYDYVRPFCNMTQSIPFNKKTIKFRSKKIHNDFLLLGKKGYDFDYFPDGGPHDWFYKAAEVFLNDYTKAHPVMPDGNISFQQSFSYFGFQSPPLNQKELHRAYREMINKDHYDKKDINAMYIRALEYFNPR